MGREQRMNSNELTFTAPSWDFIEELTVKLYYSIIQDNFIPDIIAGISRGGLVPARIVSDLFLSQGIKVTLSIMQIGFYAGIAKTEKEPIIYQDLPGRIHGRSQPFQQLYVGLAGYEALQEGLAVLSEYLVGGLSRPRPAPVSNSVVLRVVEPTHRICCRRLPRPIAMRTFSERWLAATR